MTIERYIEENRVCIENIFRDWTEFLNVAFANGCIVEAVLWYDYCKVCEQEKSLGGGGYRDKKNEGYMWAETQIYDDDLSNRTLAEMLEYISDVRNTYPEHDLYPSFYIGKHT